MPNELLGTGSFQFSHSFPSAIISADSSCGSESVRA